ncbi:TraB/GumN family protein [Chitinophaga pinensis]|uniref:TraB/GumN family protein n=1 Tax=Chitinophaga pinensis TaxID=79329 RepID=UPI001648B5DD|nr:TraB/GumN family protein [Chitinophaga pinensis]
MAFNPVSAQQQPKGLLWEITGKGLSKPAYLFGSMHIYDTGSYQLPQVPFDLLDKVDKLYLELDLGKIDPKEMMDACTLQIAHRILTSNWMSYLWKR